jgi:hypothetical protein
MKALIAAAFAFLIILCSWFAIWPIYEWIVGIRPWFEFLNQNQMMLFGFGVILFIPLGLMGKKVVF